MLIGWRHEGLFCSVDAGMSWTLAEGSPHMHSDLRALHFDPTDTSGRQVYVCSDGELVGSPNLLQSFESGFNRRLPTLQFASPFNSSRSFWGTLGSSPVIDGLVGGGTQDDGVVYASLEPSPTPWRKLDGGDGQLFTILQDGQALFYINDPGSARRAVFNPDQQRFGGDTVVPFANIEKGLEYPVAERVQQPFWRNSDGQVLSAVAGSRKGDAPFIFGCFGEGPDLHWVQLRLLSIGNSFVSAVGSLHGDEIFAGTGDGRMFAYAPASGALEEHSVGIKGNRIVRIVALREATAFAIAGPFLLQRLGSSWSQVGGGAPGVASGSGLPTDKGPFLAMDINSTTTPETLFVATDAQVFVSRNIGQSWLSASIGLPRRPHSSDLRVSRERSGQRFLYLSTYGRSLWRT